MYRQNISPKLSIYYSIAMMACDGCILYTMHQNVIEEKNQQIHEYSTRSINFVQG